MECTPRTLATTKHVDDFTTRRSLDLIQILFLPQVIVEIGHDSYYHVPMQKYCL